VTSSSAFHLPPITYRTDGEERRVGFELEFAGITIEQTAEALKHSLGGTLVKDSAAQWRLETDDLGEFEIELDWAYLKRKAAEVADPASGEQDPLIDTLKTAAALVVPVEVVCPPIALSRLDCLDPMVRALHDRGAVGTHDSLLAAFGVHVNAEVPALDVTTLTGYVKAFALLQWWLAQAHEVDFSRKITPYIDPYPEAYIADLLVAEYATTDALADDYLAHNATRNRALDLLPLLSHLDSDRVKAAVDDPRIKSRPAFHYRLPNCHIAREDWTLASTWNLWVVVERLAARADDIAELSQAFLDQSRPLLGVNRRQWVEFIDRWLSDHGLV
jgi:hypothetical protein